MFPKQDGNRARSIRIIGHDAPESPVTINRNHRSRCSGNLGHLGPEYAILTSFSSFACNDQARYTDNPEYLVSCPVSSLRQRDQWPGGHRLVFCPQILCVSLDGVPPVQLARNCAASNVSLRTPCFLNGFHVAAPQIVALITTSSLP